jgi:hypothetical protein
VWRSLLLPWGSLILVLALGLRWSVHTGRLRWILDLCLASLLVLVVAVGWTGRWLDVSHRFPCGRVPQIAILVLVFFGIFGVTSDQRL